MYIAQHFLHWHVSLFVCPNRTPLLSSSELIEEKLTAGFPLRPYTQANEQPRYEAKDCKQLLQSITSYQHPISGQCDMDNTCNLLHSYQNSWIFHKLGYLYFHKPKASEITAHKCSVQPYSTVHKYVQQRTSSTTKVVLYTPMNVLYYEPSVQHCYKCNALHQ